MTCAHRFQYRTDDGRFKCQKCSADVTDMGPMTVSERVAEPIVATMSSAVNREHVATSGDNRDPLDEILEAAGVSTPSARESQWHEMLSPDVTTHATDIREPKVYEPCYEFTQAGNPCRNMGWYEGLCGVHLRSHANKLHSPKEPPAPKPVYRCGAQNFNGSRCQRRVKVEGKRCIHHSYASCSSALPYLDTRLIEPDDD